jgi:hypothetical protein
MNLQSEPLAMLLLKGQSGAIGRSLSEQVTA